MRSFKSKDSLKITGRGTVYFVDYFQNFMEVKDEVILIDDKQYKVIDVDRPRSGFAQYKTEKDWEERDVGLLVFEIS